MANTLSVGTTYNTDTDLLIKMVVALGLPFSAVESKEFRDYQGSRTKVSRHFVPRAIEKKVHELSGHISIRLQSVASLALTRDVWSCRSNSRLFVCVTGHFFDNSGELRSIGIGFQRSSYPHTGSDIAHVIDDIIDSMSMRHKVMSITTDNASNNIAAFRILTQSKLYDNFGSIPFSHI